MEVALQNSSRYDITSPGWPHGYADNLHCVWIFTSPPGTHLVFRILYMDLEESNNCVADFVAVYNGNALTDESNANLLHKLCLSNSTSMMIEADNVMTVKFESDSYLNETGFSAYVYQGKNIFKYSCIRGHYSRYRVFIVDVTQLVVVSYPGQTEWSSSIMLHRGCSCIIGIFRASGWSQWGLGER